MNAIEMRGVSKSYGQVQALQDMCLTVPTGSIFGLMGPNGAGKTTSIKLMLGLMRLTAGSLTVLGVVPSGDETVLRRRIGFVPEDFSLYPQMTGHEILDFNARLYGCSVDENVRRLQTVFELPLARKIATYSKGMRKLLGLYIALSTEPELLILDEPTDGLDPVVRSHFLGVLAVLISTGGAVLGAVIVGKVPQAAFVLTATLHSIIALLTFASLATLLSVLVADRMKAMLFSGGIIIVLSVVGQFKPLYWLNPLALFGSSAIIQHSVPQLVPIIVGVALSVCMLWISYRMLERQEF